MGREVDVRQEVHGSSRSSFLIDGTGRVERAWPRSARRTPRPNCCGPRRLRSGQPPIACDRRSSRSTYSRAESGCFEHHGTGSTGLERLAPAHGAHAPLIAVAQSGEPVLGIGVDRSLPSNGRTQGSRRSPGSTRHACPDRRPVLAASGAVVAGERVVGARLEFSTEHVDLVHLSITPRSLGVVRDAGTHSWPS